MSHHAILAAIRQCGCLTDCELMPIGVTGNNRVFRARAGERSILVKQYFQDPADPRDRFNTERTFYDFLSQNEMRCVPQPLAWLAEERLGLLEFVEGEKPSIGTPAVVHEALEFLVALNSSRRMSAARALPAASEACFSIAEHVNCVDGRVRRFRDLAPISDLHKEAIDFVRERVAPAWNEVRAQLSSGLQSANRLLAGDERCISPSDFGFHNSIRAADGRLRFFDFEYAGWDDPAKTVCDFFCQPAVPVSSGPLEEFVKTVALKLKSPGLGERVMFLLPAYQTKWCLIMLNDFLTCGNRRRAFSNPVLSDEERWRTQLEKAIIFHRKCFP